MKPDAPELAALFEMARDGDEPSDSDRRRVTARVAQRLALGAGAGAAALTLSRVGWAVSFKAWAIAAVAVASAGSGAYLLSRGDADEHRALTAPPVAHPPPSAPLFTAPAVASAPAPTRTEPGSQPSPPPAQPHRERVSTAAPAAPSAALEPSRLARETAALRAANEALRSGAAGRSLLLLDEFAKQFPNGMLAQEALATRVSALCELGRVSEARTLGTRFVQRYPRSPVAARVRGSCAIPKEE
jgi:hypothetical protein